MGVNIGIGLGLGPDADQAAREAARQAKRSVPKPQLALAFAGIRLDQAKVHAALREELEADCLFGGSSYAEITPAGVTQDSVAVLLLELEGLGTTFADARLTDKPYETGLVLARAASKPSGAGLPLALLLSSVVSGRETEILQALRAELGPCAFFGGMACGDYDRGMGDPAFMRSFQYCGPQLEERGARLALLEWPRSIKLGFGFAHGWQPVGPAVRVTKARGGRVTEIDGIPVFRYYRQFLGEDHDSDFFRLLIQRYAFSLLGPGGSRIKLPVICDEKNGAITYFPAEELEGREVQLIQASRRGLVDGSREAARRCLAALDGAKPSFVLMVSCCTRKAILHSRMDDELDAVGEVFGKGVPIFGYYSGGELAPLLNRYEDVVSRKELSGSFYHTTTVGLLAVAAPKVSALSAPSRMSCDGDCDWRAESARLRRQLEQSEAVLDNSESFLANLSRKAYQDGEKLMKQNGVIRRYTPHEVWSRVGENAARGVYELADAEFNGCFMFLDVKGFTSFSEDNAPEAVAAALNELFAPATQAIYECGGDVDKYIGDSIFAAFKTGDDALRAGRRLLGLFKDLKKAGSPFSVRIGINSGRAVRANVGGKDRREYTYIGDAVNLAQRLESNCAPGKLLISRELFEDASVPFEEVVRKEILVKGKRKPVVCFECSL